MQADLRLCWSHIPQGWKISCWRSTVFILCLVLVLSRKILNRPIMTGKNNIIKLKKKIQCQKVSNKCDSSILLLQFAYILSGKIARRFCIKFISHRCHLYAEQAINGSTMFAMGYL